MVEKVRAEYMYAKKMTSQHGDDATSTASSAAGNCVGTGCQDKDTYCPVGWVCFPSKLLCDKFPKKYRV